MFYMKCGSMVSSMYDAGTSADVCLMIQQFFLPSNVTAKEWFLRSFQPMRGEPGNEGNIVPSYTV